MALLDHIKLEDTPEGKAVRNYVLAQHTANKELFEACMSDDIVFNGLLYKVQGPAVVPSFVEFVTTMVEAMRIEAIARAGDSDKFMILFYVRFKGQVQEIPAADLVHIKNGKIYRVDNCFDTNKVPKAIHSDAEEKSNM